MSVAFVNRPPTSQELEKLRLVLSTYQDGTGQLVFKNNVFLPGWRDFERSVALVFNGQAQESKAIFDVLLPDPTRIGINYGLSCKMRETLSYLDRTNRVTIEVSNSTGKFWNALRTHGLNEENYENNPERTGKAIIELVESWHKSVSIANGGNVDLTGSFYLALQWNKKSGYYQLFQLPLNLPDYRTLQWSVISRRLIGKDPEGVLFEWYGLSGGQLKYYPFANKAIWISDRFTLEPLPKNEVGYGILRKVAEYFPDLWTACQTSQ
jgi:hypothetical protein